MDASPKREPEERDDERQPYEGLEPSRMLLRDFLALDRTILANERTLLAYMRTSIALFAAGGTILSVYHYLMLRTLGVVLIILGFATAFFGCLRYFVVASRIQKIPDFENQEHPPRGRAPGPEKPSATDPAASREDPS